MFNQKKLISGFSYLFYFLPAALISGPFLSDLIVSILAIFFLSFTFKYKLWSYYNNYFTKFFLIFNIYLIISSIWADNTLQSLKSSIPYIRFLLFTLSIAYLSNMNKNFYKLFFKFLFITLFFLILDSYLQLIFGKNLLNQEINFTTDAYTQTMTIRVSGLFGDELILGSYVSRTVFILLGFYLYFEKQVNIYFFILFIMSAFIIIFISGERLAFFIMIFCSLYILIVIKNYRKFIISISLAVIFIISLITLSNENIKNRMILSSFAFLNPDYKEYYKPPENFVIFSPDHHELYVAAYKMFLNKPILGYGHDMYSQNCNDFKRTVSSCSTHPHNILLQIGVENGIIGLLFLFIVYFYLFSKFIKNFLKKNTEINKYFFLEICLLSIISANLFPFITSGNFFNNWMSIIFYLPVALYLSISTKKNFKSND
jgi:O-antigen ligase